MSKIIRAMSADGSLRALLIDSGDIVRAAREVHVTSPTATAALGRTLTAAALMGSLLKNPGDSITLNIRGDGPCGKILAVADYKGNVKGTISSPGYDAPRAREGKLNVGLAVAGSPVSGTLNVAREETNGEPFVGIVNLVSGEIAEDITAYFAESEQTPSLCSLGVLVARDGSVRCAGGLLIQLLPGADEAVIDRLEANAPSVSNLSSLLESGKSVEEILAIALNGIEYDLFDEIEVGYVCGCSRERMAKALLTLNPVELYNMLVADGQIETVCRFCGAKYVFHGEDIEAARGENEK